MERKEEDQMWEYLQGTMVEEEQLLFQEKLTQRPELEDELVASLVKHYGRLRLKEKFEGMHASLPKTSVIPVQRLWYLQMVAVVLLLLAPTFLFFFWEDHRIWQENLFKHVFKPYSAADLLQAFKQDSVDNSVWTRAMSYYEAESYADATSLLKELASKSEGPTYKYSFYLGVSYLGLDPPKTELAISALQEVLAVNKELTEPAKWYIALAYWEQGEREIAKRYFEDIASQSGFFNREAAKDILNQESLDSIRFVPAPFNLPSSEN